MVENGSMNKLSQSPIHSAAVALLAIAVIVLAIKEPKDCRNSPEGVGASDAAPAPATTRTNPTTQRELRKF